MKKNRWLTLLLALLLTCALCACGGTEGDAGSDESAAEDVVYHVGDTWEVEGQWKLTVDSVTTTDERNEFEESDPAQVIVVEYHYENIGYEDEDGLMDGLYLDMEMGQIMDAAGNMCSSYPLGSLDDMAKETPVGGKCAVKSAFGLKEAGSPVKIIMTEYDGNGDEQKATFELAF